MKKWIIFIALIAAVFGGYKVWSRQTAGQKPVEAGRPTTAKIELRNINFNVTAAGDIGPDEMVSVRPEVNGRIKELPVDIGDRVTKGTLLCALNDRDLQTERDTQVTEVSGAKLQVEKTRRNYERSKRLYEENLIAQELFEDTLTEYELAQNALEKAERTLVQIDERISKTRIVAPFDCTVLTRPVSIGQAVSGSGGVSGGTEIMSIANLREMIITAHLNQADVARLRIGQEVEIQVEAVPGLIMKGTVERIAPQATIKNNIKGFATQVRLKDLDPRVRPGMTANMTIPLQSAPNAVAIPLAAVFSEQGERYAYVVTGNGFEVRPIQIGVADFQYAEVLSGLQTGEVVSLIRPANMNGLVPESQEGRRTERADARTNGAGKARSIATNATNARAATPSVSAR